MQSANSPLSRWSDRVTCDRRTIIIAVGQPRVTLSKKSIRSKKFNLYEGWRAPTRERLVGTLAQ